MKAQEELEELGIELPGRGLRRASRVVAWIVIRPFVYRLMQVGQENRQWTEAVDRRSLHLQERLERLERLIGEIDGTLNERWLSAERQLADRENAWLDHIQGQAVIKSDLHATANRLSVIEALAASLEREGDAELPEIADITGGQSSASGNGAVTAKDRKKPKVKGRRRRDDGR